MDIYSLLIVLAVILVSMTLHEAMHGFVAYALGDDTAKLQGRLTLNPIKHIDPFLTILLPLLLAISGGPIFGGAKPVPFNPDLSLIHISEPTRRTPISYAVFCLKKK